MWVELHYKGGCKLVGKAKMDERGRILIPLDERERLGLRCGVEFDLVREDGVLVLKPILVEPLRVDGSHRKWGKEAFLDSGEATFGE
jgi:bifunctional DNA-binding transcriptional regulator/antitoxin component of YhaV-PrlF toxin-antitoxin module